MAVLYIQDPEGDGFTTLDALVALANDAATSTGIFAFASPQGIDMLFNDPAIQSLAENGAFELIVGISAITNRRALERLMELETEFAGFQARVLWDRVRERLVHPKICVFGYPSGEQALLVGSGNLTPGGLRDNYEAFSVHTPAQGDLVDAENLSGFLDANRHNLFEVDNPHVLARAGLNVRTVHRGALGAGDGEEADVTIVAERNGDGEELVLVGFAPKGRAGWAQLQLNLDVWAQFFRIPPVAGEQLTLQQRRSDGGMGEVENRALVYPANTNQNIRIELSAARGKQYPPDGAGRPIVLFRDRGARMFQYIALEPGDDGHAELTIMLEAAPDSIGRGVTRVLRPLPAVRRIWPQCPW